MHSNCLGAWPPHDTVPSERPTQTPSSRNYVHSISHVMTLLPRPVGITSIAYRRRPWIFHCIVVCHILLGSAISIPPLQRAHVRRGRLTSGRQLQPSSFSLDYLERTHIYISNRRNDLHLHQCQLHLLLQRYRRQTLQGHLGPTSPRTKQIC